METGSVIDNNKFTCITCRVAFRDLEIQRLHYKSDWHRFNLYRKANNSPSSTLEEFQEFLLTEQAKNAKALKSNDPTKTQCKVCHKSFYSEEQYKNHLMSKKHHDNELKYKSKNQDNKNIKTNSSDTDSWTLLPPNNDGDETKQLKKEKIASMDTEDDVESYDSDENPVEQNYCLFCDHHSKSWVKNLKHMTEKHSFFLPDIDYCVDPKGLLEHLGEQIYVYFECIWCKGKRFYSSDAARAHMIDKGHCKMIHEGTAELEYAHFYDYSKSYPDEDEDQDIDEDVAVIDIDELDTGEHELTLPSGKVVGHRSLMMIYKQRLNSNSPFVRPKSEKIQKILGHYRALGWTGSEKAQIVEKARDIKYMQRVYSKYSTQLNFKANKFQKHYREQVNF